MISIFYITTPFANALLTPLKQLLYYIIKRRQPGNQGLETVLGTKNSRINLTPRIREIKSRNQ